MNAEGKLVLAALTALTALLAAGPAARAQGVDTSLPLTSVGDRLMWTVGDQTLNLNVAVGGRIRLDLYSPRVDPADYRSDRFYGDEVYGGPAVTTTFSVLADDGTVVVRRTFTPGSHAWDTLLDQELPAGHYRLSAQTSGNGKNTFAVRLTGLSADMQSDRLTVTIHAQDWVPAVNVTTDGAAPYVVRMYDGDGPGELEARVRDEQGRVTPLPVSGDLAWTDLPLPQAAGRYVIELRQAGAARQHSNSVGISLMRAGASTPLTLTRVDQTGQLRVTAELVLPGSVQPTSADVTVGQQTLRVVGSLTQRVPAGEYPLSVAPIPGAEVALDRSALAVPQGGLSDARVEVRPQVALSVEADKTEVCVGDTVTLRARASTAYAGALPLQLTLDVPGLRLQGATEQRGTFSAAQPGALSVTGVATAAGPLTVLARLFPWGQLQSVRVNVLPTATRLQLSRAPLEPAQVGDTRTVHLTVRNTAAQPMAFVLHDTPSDGLEAVDAPDFQGTLAAGEARELSYRVRVTAPGTHTLQARLDSRACSAPQTVGGTLTAVAPATPVTPAPEPRPAPSVSRESTVTLPYSAPARSGDLVIAHRPPAGASFVPGSSRLNGQALPDPLRGASGTLYWVLPVSGIQLQQGQLSYRLTHQDALGVLDAPALLARPEAAPRELLQGVLDPADLAAATPLTETAPDAENEGAIRLPLQGSVLRIRDRISVVVDAPLGPVPTLSVNGRAISEDSIGSVTTDSARGVQRLVYVGVPLTAGPNVLKFLNDTVTVQLVGSTTRLEVRPEQLLADGSTPVRVRVRALDAAGNLTSMPSVTLRTSLEPRTPDADSGESGYQLRLQNGEGVLELQPQASPTTLQLDLQNGDQVQRHTFEIRPDDRRVGVGVLSATVGLDGQLSSSDLSWQGRASFEGPLQGGKLYAVADKDGLPTGTLPLVRNPVIGDASSETVTLQGSDPAALLYDHPAFRVQYRRTALPMDVLPVSEQFTALSGYSKGSTSVSGFVALVPRDRVSELPLTPSGTRLLRLPAGGIVEGSETLVLVTVEPDTGKILKRQTLTRDVDYVLDTSTGIITLTRVIEPLDPDLNRLQVLASYRLLNAETNRPLAFGAQVRHTGEHYTVGVAAVRLDQATTYGARATYDNGAVHGQALLAYSGGLQGSADVSAPVANGTLNARVRYQQAGYQGLGAFDPGLTAGASYQANFGTNLKGVLDGDYHHLLTGDGGSVGARAELRVAPFTVGGGLRYAFGDTYGVGAVGSVGYQQGRLDAKVVHTQPLTGNLDPTTNITAKFRVTDKVSLGLTDAIVWGAGDTGDITQAAVLSLDAVVGNVNYAAGYELPTAAGAGNRARFGVSTGLTLSERVSLGLRGSAVYDLGAKTSTVGAGANLNYHTGTVSATAGSDVTFSGGTFGVVLRGGVTGSVTPNLTLTADALGELTTDRSGLRASLGYAYRTGTLNSLGYARYQQGSLGGTQPEMSAGVSAEEHRSNWAVRGAVDTRTLLNDPDSFTVQAQAGGTYYLSDRFGVGAWGRLLSQPASSSTQAGYGLEASVRALPGTWLTAGYNFRGFEGLPSSGTYTKPGLYVRLDLTVDDQSFGGNK
ncbi:DUF11 domain-containing protein [Deinococcus sonorensis]|uniref:DUF11 domain-containing protein n=1 Tax=Deinococcus sonorensis KR-87 TaxID=694439 RepID=A0AAU7UCX8_9DEIO